ncbi:hypothetical protein JDFnp4_52 [Fusobacterium phage JD-Fnp4]|jgi:hypothetical protein|nr:hypothetical protein JDFnp4_52 [Fusobacterium phage JD-Fnp4]DAR86921.1 MAG TPA: hypothetical protein [Bacteriophage sp.]
MSNNNKGPFSSILENAGTLLTTLIGGAIVGLVTLTITTYQQAIEINHINESVHDIQVTMEELKHRSVASDVRLSTHEDNIKKLQEDMDEIKYRLGAIPDRTELNKSFDSLYNKISDKMDRKH